MITLCLAFLFLAAGITLGNTQPAVRPNELENFSFVVGEWEGTFKLYPSAIVPKQMETPAAMISQWGRQKAWIESEATMEIASVGTYVAKVIVRFDSRESAYDAFVVNTVGGGAPVQRRQKRQEICFCWQSAGNHSKGNL